MIIFVVLNWFFLLTIASIILISIFHDRSLILKPSVAVIIYFHIMYEWAATLKAVEIFSFLQEPWIFLVLSHGFPCIGLIVTLKIGRKKTDRIFKRIVSTDFKIKWSGIIGLLPLVLLFAVFIVLYLSYVPFEQTGLYKIAFDHVSSVDAAIARDMSVKFLDNAALRYGYTIIMGALAPLLAVFAFQLGWKKMKCHNWGQAMLFFLSVVVIGVFSTLSGARAYPAYILMAILFSELIRRGLPFKPIRMVIGLIVILLLPTVLTLLREGKPLDMKLIGAYLLEKSLYSRMMIIPMETGLWHVHYAQKHGFFGVSAIPKLAALVGIASVNVPNIIAQTQFQNPKTTSTSNTAFVYAYYSYFGLIAFIPCLIGLWLLDSCLLLYERLSSAVLLPCVATISMAANLFANTEYTIALFSQGFLFVLLFSWGADRFQINWRWWRLMRRRKVGRLRFQVKKALWGRKYS